MHTIQSWSINSSFSFYSLTFIFFVLQSFNSQAQTPMTARQFTKRRYHCHLGNSQKNIDDNLRPAIDLLHSWDSKSLLAIIGLDNNQLAGTDAQRAADFQQQLDNNIAWLKKKEVMVELLICWILPNLNKVQNGLLVLAISPFYTII
jgi:muramoyltetrapeptide carboxypeptidase